MSSEHYGKVSSGLNDVKSLLELKEIIYKVEEVKKEIEVNSEDVFEAEKGNDALQMRINLLDKTKRFISKAMDKQIYELKNKLDESVQNHFDASILRVLEGTLDDENNQHPL